MIDKSIYGGNRLVLLGKLISGHAVRIEFEDKGDICPGFNKDGKTRYAAFTTWMRFEWPKEAIPPSWWPPRSDAKPPAKNYLEDYSQVSQREAASFAGGALECRLRHDMSVLASMTVDVQTLEIDASVKPVNVAVERAAPL